jgi:hypothetical protein
MTLLSPPQEEDNLSENLIAGSEQQKRDYIATISGTTDGVISLNLKSASSNPDATNLALILNPIDISYVKSAIF